MTDKAFIDTNVLVYAHDVDAGTRRARYLHRSRAPWPGRSSRPTPWQTELVGPPEIQLASELEEQHKLSFWDALIVAAALKGGARTILTEDMSPGRSLSGVQIQNPFTRNR